MTDYEITVNMVCEQLAQLKIIPVLAIEKLEDGMKMCELLNKNGLKTAEITFRTKAAASIIREASNAFPEMEIGAGTVLNIRDLHRAFEAGSKFAVAPGFNPTVVKEAIANNFPFFPGISSPSDIEQAYELGVRVMKFFPAEAAGGLKFLTNISAPYKHLGIRYIPTGGLNTENIMTYLNNPNIIAAGGTWLGKSADIEAGDWDKIDGIIKAAVELIK